MWVFIFLYVTKLILNAFVCFPLLICLSWFNFQTPPETLRGWRGTLPFFLRESQVVYVEPLYRIKSSASCYICSLIRNKNDRWHLRCFRIKNNFIIYLLFPKTILIDLYVIIFTFIQYHHNFIVKASVSKPIEVSKCKNNEAFVIAFVMLPFCSG